MTMTTEEIVRDYRASKTPMKQIGILAQLNACDTKTIVNILIDAGCSVPGNFLPRRNKEARARAVELESKKETFELDTTNPPLLRKDITVGALIDALQSVPGDAILAEGYNAIRVTISLDLRTGMRKTFVSIGREEAQA